MLWMLLGTELVAGAVPWFEQPLSYFDGVPYGVVLEVEEEEGDETPQGPSEAPDFDWSDYEDPGSVEFWREGDFAPSAPMMALVRDPSPENAEKYRAWLAKKMEVTAQISALMVEPEAPVSWQDVTVVYFYALRCPHCKRNAPVVAELARRGATVLPVHLDAPSPALPGSVPLTEDMARQVQLVGTPTFVLSTGVGQRATVRGFADMGRLEAELRTLQGETR